MSKEENIANIVKELDKLSISETGQILKYIKNAKDKKERTEANREKSTKAEPTHIDKDGVTLSVGDRVVLLTKGVDNSVYEEATIKILPEKEGKYIHLVPQRFENAKHQFYIRKLAKSVRKIDN